MSDKNKRLDYGNWISADQMRALDLVSIGMIFLTLAAGRYLSSVATAATGIVMVFVLMFTLYMQSARSRFSAEDGALMRELCDFTLSKLPPAEVETPPGLPEEELPPVEILDDGCGTGQMTARCALRFDDVRITAADGWKKSGAREQCAFNLRSEGVADRVDFSEQELTHLDFADETFDAVISCYGFHHAGGRKTDSKPMLEESLRVLKKGGSFAITDFFCDQSVYGDMVAYLEELKQRLGIRELHFIPNVEKSDFVPALLRVPWLLGGSGLIYGIK